jgi:hypothetical protein
MKKMTKRKLVLGREVVTILRAGLQGARMQDARGGRPVVVANSDIQPAGVCSQSCQTIDQ